MGVIRLHAAQRCYLDIGNAQHLSGAPVEGPTEVPVEGPHRVSGRLPQGKWEKD